MGTFSDQQTISTYWFNKSQELRNAATCVWQAMEHSQKTTIGDESIGPPSRSSYFMLCGMSLEAMLKAILIETSQTIPKSHNLARLAKLANVSYDAHETDLLDILSAAIVWDGRYPVPLTQEEWDRLLKLEGSKLFNIKPLGPNSKLRISTPNDELNWSTFNELWSRSCSDLLAIAHWVSRSK